MGELVADKLSAMMDADLSTHDAVTWLRDAGCSKIEAIRLISQGYGIPLGETKILVHSHPAWEETREAHEKFHERLAAHSPPKVDD